MIAWTSGRGPCHLFCSASRTRVPAKVLEQWLFETLGNNLFSTGITFAPWLFRVVKWNLTGLFFVTIPTNDMVIFVYFVFCSSVSWDIFGEKSQKTRIAPHGRKIKSKKRPPGRVLVLYWRITLPNFVLQLETTRVQYFEENKFRLLWNQLVKRQKSRQEFWRMWWKIRKAARRTTYVLKRNR